MFYIPTFEIMPRESYNPEWEGISFDQFLLKSKAEQPQTVSAVLAAIDKMGLTSEDENLFNNKLNYLIQTSKTLENRQDEIIQLWDLLIKNIIHDVEFDISSDYNNDIYPLISITIEAKVSRHTFEKKDLELHKAIMDKILEKLTLNNPLFVQGINELLFWYENRISYLSKIPIGIPGDESSIIKVLIEDNHPSLELLKQQAPYSYIRFIELYKTLFKINSEYKIKHKSFYKEQCRNQIIACKSSSIYFNYYYILKDFQEVNLEKKKWQYYILDFLVGFGEKPLRLILWFFTVNFFFSIAFYCFGVQIKGIGNLNAGIEKFFNYLYFNNTTMLTVGYGDHYPTTIGAKMSVIILQLLGFIISASAVSLYIRKIFRE